MPSPAHTNHTDEWLTPIPIADALIRIGGVDLDPCAHELSIVPARREYNLRERGENGLTLPWLGLSYDNPPYSTLAPWVRKAAEHGRSITLCPARLDTAVFFDEVYRNPACEILAIKGRLRFLEPLDSAYERAMRQKTPEGQQRILRLIDIALDAGEPLVSDPQATSPHPSVILYHHRDSSAEEYARVRAGLEPLGAWIRRT